MISLNQKLVSIAVATYNGEKYLTEQLDSIFNQTYKNIEVIVSDDHSTDGTAEILRKYSEKSGLKFSINEKNIGVVKNFENAVSKCSGEYILLSDQDDIWMPDKIETLAAGIGNFSLIYSDGYILNSEDINHERKISRQKWIKPFGIDSSDDNLYKYLIFNSFILGSSLMFKRELLNTALPFYKSYRNHDWWLAICAENENGIKYIDHPLFYYRIHGENYSIGLKINILKRILMLFSHDRIVKRKILQQKGNEVINYLSRTNFFRNTVKKEYGDYVNKINNTKTTIYSKLIFIVFLFRTKKFIFPTYSCLELIPLLALRTFE